MWQKLADVLKEITGYYQKLLQLGQKKRRILVQVDLKSLEQLLKEETRLIEAIHQAEKKRQDILVQLSRQESHIRPDTKLAELCQYSPSPAMTAVLMRLHQELDQLIADVKQAGSDNHLLVSSALSAVHYQLNRLGNASVEPAYGSGGKEMISHQKNFDFHA